MLKVKKEWGVSIKLSRSFVKVKKIPKKILKNIKIN
jgi:hypothetical protein